MPQSHARSEPTLSLKCALVRSRVTHTHIHSHIRYTHPHTCTTYLYAHTQTRACTLSVHTHTATRQTPWISRPSSGLLFSALVTSVCLWDRVPPALGREELREPGWELEPAGSMCVGSGEEVEGGGDGVEERRSPLLLQPQLPTPPSIQECSPRVAKPSRPGKSPSSCP